jgi:hypothetical protein
MSMSPLLFRRSFHGRAGLVLSSTEPVVVARSDRRVGLSPSRAGLSQISWGGL